MNDEVVTCCAMLVWQSQRARPCRPIHLQVIGFIKADVKNQRALQQQNFFKTFLLLSMI